MTQRDLNAAVARATGEDLRLIRRRGFSIIDLHDDHFDPEPNQRPPQILDWDEVDQQHNFHQPRGAFRMTS